VRSGVWVIVLALMITACNVDAPPDMAKLKAPAATRIITLAPHLTELVFSVGAGDRLVGVVEYSDFPSAALEIPRIGDAFRVDYEAIAELDPDLILAWQSGTPREVVDRLGQLGYRIVAIEAGSLNQVADSLRVIGQLVGTVQIAAAAATAFEHSLEEIRSTTDERAPIAVFYQVSSQPLFTISRQHVIGEAIELCGGKNVFADLVGLSPAISPEAVIEAAPGVIIATRYTDDESAENPLAVWYQWSSIPAVRDGNLFLVDANLMTRPSIRILDGVRELCARIATAQRKGV
jgi:iron complex transport system substrate-binding protein